MPFCTCIKYHSFIINREERISENIRVSQTFEIPNTKLKNPQIFSEMRHANESTDRHTTSQYALITVDIMQGKTHSTVPYSNTDQIQRNLPSVREMKFFILIDKREFWYQSFNKERKQLLDIPYKIPSVPTNSRDLSLIDNKYRRDYMIRMNDIQKQRPGSL